ncbi:hypothetical protein chiPu_0029167, partial [Chiloscyllium punctatum]|nr:hypothetical protein [Chiloscyllium punctatum]
MVWGSVAQSGTYSRQYAVGQCSLERDKLSE